MRMTIKTTNMYPDADSCSMCMCIDADVEENVDAVNTGCVMLICDGSVVMLVARKETRIPSTEQPPSLFLPQGKML